MPSDQTLVMPVQGRDLEYRHIAQIVGRDLGVEAWGSAVEHVSYSSSSQYAHTIRNRGSGGHLNVLKSTDGATVFNVNDSGVFIETLTVTTLNAGTVNATTANIATVNATTANVGTVNATTANVGTVTATTANVGTVNATTVSVAGQTTLNGQLSANSTAQFNGNVQVGNSTADALTILAGTTFTDETGVTITQFVDTANRRTVYGTQTPPGGLANDLLDVIGGRAYFVGTNEQISIGLRYGPAQTGTYYLGVTNQSTPSLILKDTSGDEVASFGDSGDTYQMVLTGVGRFTSRLVVGSGLSGTESFRVASGTSLFSGGVTVASGGLTVSSGGIGVTGASVFSTGVSIITGDLTMTAGDITFPNTKGVRLADNGGTLRTSLFITAGNICCVGDANVDLALRGANIGFYGSSGTSKQTVTGSRGGNAALASLLSALANLNLITNSTT